MYGSWSAADRPATAPPGGSRAILNYAPTTTASSNVAARKCANDVDFETIVALSRQFTAELEVKTAEKAALTKIIGDAKRAITRNQSVMQKKKAQLDKMKLQTGEVEKRLVDTDAGNTSLRHDLSGLLRENEKLATEVETMTEQMKELLRVYGEHRQQVASVTDMSSTYRKEVVIEKKKKDDVCTAVRTHRTARSILEERIDDAARRKHLLKTCIADVFVSSAG